MTTLKDPLTEAVEHHQAGRLQDAERLYRQLLEKNPDDPDALHLLGLIATQMGQHQVAVDLISRAVVLAPATPMFHSNIGTAYGELGRHAEAESAYRQALKLKPTLTAAMDNLARLLKKQGREAEIDKIQQEITAANTKHVQFQAYQNSVEQKRKTPYMDYPSHVHMETLAKCNAACVFCPYPDLERQGAKMEDSLVEKIIGDLTDIPSTLPFQLSPFKVNEPFLDVRLFDILHSINTRLPNALITLTTNATPITEKKLTELTRVKNLRYLWISFNDHREKDYEATMKLPYQRTIERLNMIHQHKTLGDMPFRVVLSRVGDGSPVDQEFCHWVKQQYPLFDVEVFQRGAWIGQVKDIEQDVPDVGCTRWFDLSITATGVVAHCCMDGQAKWPIGDVNKQHVLEIYNSPHYRQLRESTLSRKSASPCNQCAFL